MDPISITALVCAIISAYTGAASLFKARKEKKKKKTADSLRKSLAIAPPQVQKEYDHNFRRLGPIFAAGDAISHHQLSSTLIDLQSKMIGTLQAMLNGGQGSYTSLLDTSNNSRLATISSLSAQFQRLSQAAPIQSSLSTPWVYGKCALWEDTDKGEVHTECIGIREDNTKFTIPKGRKCTVLNECSAAEVWVRFQFLDTTQNSTAYRVPKWVLSRESGPYKAVSTRSCPATREDGVLHTLEIGRECTVYHEAAPGNVWIRISYDEAKFGSNQAYWVDKTCLQKV